MSDDHLHGGDESESEESERDVIAAENRLLKASIWNMLDTIRCAGEVLEKLIGEKK
jgi:hypothetical protein